MIVCFLLSFVAVADVPQGISYQGRLNDAGGSPLNGSVNITFSLYEDDGGAEPLLWNEQHNGVTVDNGVFDVVLGSVNPFPGDLFSVPLLLGVQVDPDPEMTPRQPLLTAPYAFRAQSVEIGVIDADALADDAVETSKIADGAVTADKIDDTGLNSDTVDGIDGGEIITTTDGGVISNADLEVAGTGLIKATGGGIVFADGSLQTTAPRAAGAVRTINVNCGAQSLQAVLNSAGPGGALLVVIDGVCNGSINIPSTATRVEIRGDCNAGSNNDRIVGSGGPAVIVNRPAMVWLSDLVVDGGGDIGVSVQRNGVVSMYDNGCGGVTLTGSSFGAFAQHGGVVMMSNSSANGNANGSLILLDGAVGQLVDVNFEETMAYEPAFDIPVQVGRHSTLVVTGSSTVIRNLDDAGGAIDVYQHSALRLQDALVDGHVSVGNASQASIRNGCTVNGRLQLYDGATADFRACTLDGLGGNEARIDVSNRSSLTLRNGAAATVGEISVYRGDLNVRGGTALVCANGAGTCDIDVNGGTLNLDADFDGNELRMNDGANIELVGGTVTVNQLSAGNSRLINAGANLEFGAASFDRGTSVSLFDGSGVGCKGAAGSCDVWMSDATLELNIGFVGQNLGVSDGSMVRVENYDGNPAALTLVGLNVDERSAVSVGVDGTLEVENVNVNTSSTLNLFDGAAFACAGGGGTCDIFANVNSRVHIQTDVDANGLHLGDGSLAEVLNWNGGTPTLTLNDLHLNERAGFVASDGGIVRPENLNASFGATVNLSDSSTFECKSGAGSCSIWLGGAKGVFDTAVEADVNAGPGASLSLNAELTDPQLNLNGATLELASNGKVSGDVYCSGGCAIEGWDGEITGQVDVVAGSHFSFGDSLTLAGPINVGDNSQLDVANNVTWGSGVPGVWPGGPKIRADKASNVRIGDGTAIDGGIAADNGSHISMGDNSSVSEQLQVNYRSNANIGGVVSVDTLQVAENSSLHVDGQLTVAGDAFLSGGSGVFLRDGASMTLTGSHMFMEQGSHLDLSNGSSFGRPVDTDPAVNMQDFTTVAVGDNVVVTGTVGLGGWSKMEVRGSGVTFDGDITLYSALAGNVINFSNTVDVINGHVIDCFGNSQGVLAGAVPNFVGGGSIDAGCTGP